MSKRKLISGMWCLLVNTTAVQQRPHSCYKILLPIHLFCHHLFYHTYYIFSIGFAKVVAIAAIRRTMCFCSECTRGCIQPLVAALYFHYMVVHKCSSATGH